MKCRGDGDLGLDGTCFAGERDGDETQDHVLVIAFEPSSQSSILSADPARWSKGPFVGRTGICRWSEIVSSARPSESTATARIDGSRTVSEVHKRSCKPNGHRTRSKPTLTSGVDSDDHGKGAGLRVAAGGEPPVARRGRGPFAKDPQTCEPPAARICSLRMSPCPACRASSSIMCR